MTNQYAAVIAYFEQIATDYSPIGHTAEDKKFFCNTMDSVRNDLAADDVILYLSDQQYAGAEQDGSNTLNPIVRITVLENYEMEDFEAEKQALNNAFGHIKEIEAQIIEDRKANHYLMKSFNQDDVSIFAETPINDRWIGMTLTFTLRLDEAFVKTPELWA